MPKNKKKGKNNKNKNSDAPRRTLLIKEELQEYGKISKLLGDRRVRVILIDTSEILGIIPGRFRRRCWMRDGDIILVSRRDFQADRVDILHKYTDSEARQLAKMSEIPPFFLSGVTPEVGSSGNIQDEELGFEFDVEEI